MIVITAPTSQIGRHVVRNLLALDTPLRLIVRDARKLDAAVRDRVEVIEGSHGDAAIVQKAFVGADAVFWLVPLDLRQTPEQLYLDFTRPAAEAFRSLGVKRVVAITALGADTEWQDRAGLISTSIRMERLIRESGVAFRGLAMPTFMDNMLRQASTIKAHGKIYGPIDPLKKMPSAATRDMGALAARLLADETWSGQQEMPVLGPEDLSMTDMAAILSEIAGREVSYEQVSFDVLGAQMRGAGASESFAQGYVDMMRAKNQGIDNIAKRTEASAAPTTFRQWCLEELRPALQG